MPEISGKTPQGAKGSRRAGPQAGSRWPASFAFEFQSIAWFQVGFLLVFILVRHLLPHGILFYQGMGLGFCAGVLEFVLEWKLRRLPLLGAVKNSLLSFLLIYAFVFTIPTTVDRSYSVMFLNRLDRSPAGLTQAEVEDIYIQGFTSGGATEKRLQEQISTGTIRETNGRYVLTPFGRFLSASFHFTQAVFACKEKP